MQGSNTLQNELSPYLLQHADNPVNWYPWGDEALQLARAREMPIFLSVGYATCHWCHVMADETFVNEKAAELLNKWFVSIKVDREERPDIDQLYMDALITMQGSGGWPMSLFLFPDGKPFFAATYIPLEDRFGRSGFIQLLETIHQAWEYRRDELAKTADKVFSLMKPVPRQPLDDQHAFQTVHATADSFAASYDQINAGFGGAPKFPRPVVLRFLFSYGEDTNEKKYTEMAVTTLLKMVCGGIYDQIGGGFHRYSVDAQWHVPHFEKMLYDQAQLVQACTDAYELTGDSLFSDTIHQTLQYVLTKMTAADGGFFSAEDADSEDPYTPGRRGEGCYYLWTSDDLVRILGDDQAAFFSSIYGVVPEGNVAHDPHLEFAGKNILLRKGEVAEVARHFQYSLEEAEKMLSQAVQKLREARERRQAPFTDDKIVTAWNGMMIGAMARAGGVLACTSYINAAISATTFVREKLYDDVTGLLRRRCRNGRAGLAGQLDDYVQLVSGLVELYKVSEEPHLLEWALVLTEKTKELFWEESQGCFFDSVDDKTLLLRRYATFDGAEPAANSQAAMNLLVLAPFAARGAEHLGMVDRILRFFSRKNQAEPTAMPLMQQVRLIRMKQRDY
ncbi:MAG: thioredoxin domain-containing protein [Desulfobulbus propionicus]|nr:MAG: thioredoxin domain-containing protein [Desulfobulbus propionicus]